MSVEFSDEAKQRIVSLGTSEITSFIEESPQTILRSIYRILPKVDGFRRNSSAEFKEKHKRFVMHLVRQTQQRASREWAVFAKIWEVWAREVLDIDLPELDEREDAIKQAIDFFNEIKISSPYLSKQEAERLYLFSGFSSYDKVDKLISTFKSESDIKLERMMAELPTRLSGVESKVKAIDKKHRESIKVSLNYKEDLDSFNENLNSITKYIESLEDKLSQVYKGLEKSYKLNEKLDLVEKSGRKEISKVLSELSRIDSALSNHAIELETIAKKESQDLLELIEKLEKKLNSIEKSNTFRNNEEFNTLSQKVTSLEGEIEGFSLQTGEQSISCSYVKIEHKDEATILDSKENICGALTTNLQALGFNKRDSQHLARQIFATLASGLIVQFSGSLADLVADVVALAVGGTRVFEWKVPIGLVDSRTADSCLEMANQFGAKSFVLKGGNLSAFEVYGNTFRETVVQRLFSRSVKYYFPLIVSLKQGASVFPSGGMIAELGPVVNTDDYQLRDKVSKKSKIVYGEVQTKHLYELFQADELAHSADIEEFQELLRTTDFRGGNLWNRSINRFYQTLRVLPGGSEESDFKTALMSYALPWAEAKGVSTEAIVKLSKNELYSSDLEEII